MHPLAARTVRLALANGARFDPIEHFADLVALDAAAQDTQRLPIWRECDLLDRPVLVGDPENQRAKPALLYPPSPAASQWIRECACEWFRPESLTFSLAVAWALAHGRDTSALPERGCSPSAARRAIREWAYTLGCSTRALLRATERLMESNAPQPEPEPNAGSAAAQPRRRQGSEWTALARLLAEIGENESYWLYGPEARLEGALELLRRKDAAEDAAVARLEKRAAARDVNAPEVEAFRRWRAASERFLRKFAPAGASSPAATSARPADSAPASAAEAAPETPAPAPAAPAPAPPPEPPQTFDPAMQASLS